MSLNFGRARKIKLLNLKDRSVKFSKLKLIFYSSKSSGKKKEKSFFFGKYQCHAFIFINAIISAASASDFFCYCGSLTL